ncbi:MAG: hypothetical protein PQJ59_09680 [Spirochaetales bacterium]|nr:hypothetical protein [Spirochaetales bacterium]
MYRFMFLLIVALFVGCDTGSNSSSGSSAYIDSEDLGNATDPLVVMDGNGNGLAIWEQSDGNVTNLWTNYYNGSSWGTAEKIEFDDTADIGEYDLEFDGSGNAIVIWDQGEILYFSYFDNSTLTWSSPETLITDEDYLSYTADVTNPKLAVNDNGDAAVVWKYELTIDSTYCCIYENGSWGSVKKLGSSIYRSASPEVDIDSEGNVMTIYRQYGSGRYKIKACYYDSSEASWDTALEIESVDSSSGILPMCIFDSNGDVLAIWKYGNYSVYFNKYSDPSWDTAEQLNSSSDYYIGQVRIAEDGNGNRLAVWKQVSNSEYLVNTKYYNGTEWEDTVVIEVTTTDTDITNTDNTCPVIAMDSDGIGYISWTEQFNDLDTVLFSTFENGEWSTPITISSNTLDDAEVTGIAADDSGTGIVIYSESDGTYDNIKSYHF